MYAISMVRQKKHEGDRRQHNKKYNEINGCKVIIFCSPCSFLFPIAVQKTIQQIAACIIFHK